MIRSRLYRLQRLTDFELKDNEFVDTPDTREELMVHLIRSLGNEDAADKLQHMINTHRQRIRDWKYSLEEKKQEIDDHRSYFIKCCCQVINAELSTGPDAFLEKDFLRHRFWIIVDSCLVEIGLRRIKAENQSLHSSDVGTSPASSSLPAPTLEDRIATYTATRPTLTFPTFHNLSENEQRLVEDVLKDQRGLKRSPSMFSQSSCTMYDRRYVAALRAQLNAAENLARERLNTIRRLEKSLQEAKQLAKQEELVEPVFEAKIEDRLPKMTAPDTTTTERRRVAGELRDLAHELALLPERLREYIANERRYSAMRARGAQPPFLENMVMLARGVSYDLTTLDLVDAGLCEIDERDTLFTYD